MRIAIVGVGRVGGYFGAKLAQAGEEVVFIARGEHLRARRDRASRVRSRAQSSWRIRVGVMRIAWENCRANESGGRSEPNMRWKSEVYFWA
jgi:ketopantoate reductase